MTVASATRYHEVYARWQGAPEAFWAEAAEAVDWYRSWDRVLDDNGGHLVALNWSMRHLYGVEPGEVYWAASDLG